LKIEFSQCEIIEPRGAVLKSFYRKMWEVFPYDRPIYDVLMKEEDSFYPMQNFALYYGNNLLGNSGIFPFRIWMPGGWVTILGIGAVATMPEYRRQGVASALLKHCMSLIDEKNVPSVLFTELPSVYEPSGFEIISQNYRAVPVKENTPDLPEKDFRTVGTLEGRDMETITRLYRSSPVFTGKVQRDDSYWRFYRMMFNPYEKPEIVFFSPGGIEAGYARYERELDRLTLTELSCPGDREDIIQALLSFLYRKSLQAGFPMLTVAMSPDHAVWKYLRGQKLPSVPEAEGVRRETFMLRTAAEEKKQPGISLFWSLSDKF
jgi:GNAT superfamily N-acetyltransferase